MKSRYYSFFLLILSLTGCNSPEAASQSPSNRHEPPAMAANQPTVQPKLISEFFFDGDRLDYNGYQIIKRKKEIDDRVECPPEDRHKPCIIPVFYTVIKQGGRVLATFDDFHFALGNRNEIALCALLGGPGKQLIISQTGPRSGRHYIVDMTSTPHILFDSNEYEVGREEVEILDLDNDGSYEIALAVTAFYMVFQVSMAETPLPRVIFKYNQQAKKYLPANHIFQRDMDPNISRDKDPRSDMGRNLDILLDYIYAGREEEGWTFFEREYQLPDKEKVKSEVLRVLRKAPAYNYIRAHRAT